MLVVPAFARGGARVRSAAVTFAWAGLSECNAPRCAALGDDAFLPMDVKVGDVLLGPVDKVTPCKRKPLR